MTTMANVPAEIEFVAEAEQPDPYGGVTLDLLVTAPDGTDRRVPAFWAGGRTWKARYASGQVGRHAWRTAAEPAEPGLHGLRGDIDIEPYAGDNPLFRHGPLTVDADRRRLCHADGTPFFWLGDTWWMGLCHRLEYPDEFGRLLADRVAKGFNVVQIVAGLYPDMEAFDPRGANEAGFPWEADYAAIRPAYFDAADERIEALASAGVVPCVVGAWGYYLPWMGRDKLCAHWRYLIARWGALPVVWCVAGEANLPWYRAAHFPSDDQEQAAGWCQVMAYVKATDPWHRPVTIHPTAINAYTARHVATAAEMMDFDLLQTPHGERDAAPSCPTTVAESLAAEPRMPVINGEAAYEMLLDRIPARWSRAMFWLCVTSGAAGHTYGANGIWQCNRPGRPHGPSPTVGSPPTGYGAIPWSEAMNLPGSAQIAAGKRWLTAMPDWWTFSPAPADVAWADDAPPAPPDVPPCQLAAPDGRRIAYRLDPRPLTVSGLRPATTYRLTSFDPEAGAAGAPTTVTTDAAGTLTITPRLEQDEALLLEPLA